MYIRYTIGIILFGIGYYFLSQFNSGWWGYHYFYYTPEKYLAAQQQIQEDKKELIKEWEYDTKELQNKAALFFQEKLDKKLIPFWSGTEYDFYGKTHTPGKGKIACGYFVTTVLEDMGVKLDRNGLAQLASEAMIKKLVSETNIKRYSNQNLGRVISDIKFHGKNLYIIGLDSHTGFLLNDGNDVYFIHASGRSPWQVVEEFADRSPALIESKYRVTGCLTCDTDFINNWVK